MNEVMVLQDKIATLVGAVNHLNCHFGNVYRH